MSVIHCYKMVVDDDSRLDTGGSLDDTGDVCLEEG